MAKSTLQRLIDAGVEFTNMSRKQAESIVKQMVKAGDVRRADADKAVQELLSRSRETSDRWTEGFQRELAKQVNWMSERFDELEDRFEDLAETLTARVEQSADAATEKKAAAKKTAAKKKAATKKSATKKKSASKKKGAKKTTASKQKSAKKSTATKKTSSTTTSADVAVGTSGVAPIATSRADRDGD
ncbi:MAG: hypothetical protein AAFY28_16375 [Actinomycetota bacterium]